MDLYRCKPFILILKHPALSLLTTLQLPFVPVSQLDDPTARAMEETCEARGIRMVLGREK